MELQWSFPKQMEVEWYIARVAHICPRWQIAASDQWVLESSLIAATSVISIPMLKEL